MSIRIAGFVFCALLLSACAGHSGSFTPMAPNTAASARHVEPARDLGRRAAGKTASVVLLLKYRDQAGLDRFTGGLARSRSPRYLTQQEFLARYAPTPQQERRVIDELHRAGFTIDGRYANRTILDATAPVRDVERFFNTQIHDFRQARHGVRFASVKPLVIPSRLASLVATVTIDTVVRKRVVGDFEAPPALPDTIPVPDGAVSPAEPQTASGNVIKNPGFETGHLKPWQACSTKSAAGGVISKIAHSGKRAAATGSTSAPEVVGISCVWQLVTLPAQAVLTAYILRSTDDTDHAKAGQFAALYDAKGKLVATLFNSLVSSKHWTRQTMHLAQYAGQQVYVTFGVIGAKKDAKKYVAMSIDDVSLAGVTLTPTPSPPPPTPGPEDSPCPTAALPTPNYGPNAGWGPAAEAAGLLLPSIHCYFGSGETAAIVISAMPPTSDVDEYMQNFGITRHGSIVAEPIDGGNPNPGADDLGEATLDLETIASLAPNANVIVYVIPSLDDQKILDAYNKVLSDGTASAVNSSFSGCDTNDPSFITSSNAIAQQGAAEGVTFSGSTGDQGVECYNGSYTFGTGSPASDPYFVAVGGTESVSGAVQNSCYYPYIPTTPIADPVVWNDCVGAGGGGVTTKWPLPSYQSGLTTAAGRSVPDASMPAAGIDTYSASAGGWQTLWGTSWASPLYVAMQIEVNEACAKHLWGISALYGSFAQDPTYKYAFVDVTSGNDEYNGEPTYYTAAPNFDTASGIGIPLGVNIAFYSCGSGSHGRRLTPKPSMSMVARPRPRR
jgi:hypothetical protein